MMGTRRTRYHLTPGKDVDLEREVVRDRRGKRVTPRSVERAVRDVHEKMGPGRPSLSGRSTPSPQVTFRLPPELRRRAENRAKREGRRISDLAREALERYLAS